MTYLWAFAILLSESKRVRVGVINNIISVLSVHSLLCTVDFCLGVRDFLGVIIYYHNFTVCGFRNLKYVDKISDDVKIK